MEVPLHHVVDAKLHVIAQVIETKLVIRAVRYIRQIGFLAL